MWEVFFSSDGLPAGWALGVSVLPVMNSRVMQQGYTEDVKTEPEEQADGKSHAVLHAGPSGSRGDQESLSFTVIEHWPAPQAMLCAGQLQLACRLGP